jgi:hypothetical protein
VAVTVTDWEAVVVWVAVTVTDWEAAKVWEAAIWEVMCSVINFDRVLKR